MRFKHDGTFDLVPLLAPTSVYSPVASIPVHTHFDKLLGAALVRHSQANSEMRIVT